MYKNYFFLNRLVIELNPLLSGKKIRDIFTQDKDKLILEAGNSDSSIFLEICVNPGNNYLTIKENFIRAKKNTFNFFNKALYSTIKGIFIANDDRIISISTSSGNLFFTIRGKYTNAHFIDLQKNIESFVKAEEENIDELITELFSKTYIITPNQLDLELNTEENYFDSI
ncbi:MAG: NFACT family protein, partial [Ignavibacteriaceae bacterium]|nr:NFACT family protein [Ignavibacteriaceae bacterium]